MATAEALLKGGANINQRGAGDRTTPIVVAAINGHFDLVSYLLDHGADPNLASDRRRHAALRGDQRAVAAALVLPAAARLPAAEDRLSRADEEAARQGRRPERAHQPQHLVHASTTSTCCARTTRAPAPFWRAAYASDIAAMKLLMRVRRRSRTSPTMKVATRGNFQGGTRGGTDADPDRTARRCRPAARHAAAGGRRRRGLRQRLRRQLPPPCGCRLAGCRP